MQRPSEDDTLQRESKVEQEVEHEQVVPPTRPKLEKFVSRGQDMYEALEFFLLASPKRQVLQDGGSDAPRKQGDDARQAGRNIEARINYESAAKIALYEQDKEKLKELLELADDVTKVERFKNYHRTILRNLDQAMRIAKDYYAEFKEDNGAVRTVVIPTSEPATPKAGGQSVLADVEH